MTLDLLPDSVAILNRYASDGGVVGHYSMVRKEIMIPADCGAGHFIYRWDGDDLLLENYLQDQRAVKCDPGSCDLSKDVLIDSRLLVSLPKVVFNRDCVHPNNGLTENIIIGESKFMQPYCVVCNHVELSGKVTSNHDIPIWLDYIKPKYPEDKRDRLSFRIFADQGLLAKDLQPVVEQLLTAGEKRIFLATLNPEFETSEVVFEQVSIYDVNLESGLTIGELLY
ncbi:MAG: hypothetical protein AAF597_04040 [Bacteroidota bacterium]